MPKEKVKKIDWEKVDRSCGGMLNVDGEQDKNTPVVCRGCGIYIEFIKMKSGKFMPVEPLPIKVITKNGQVVDGYIPHWQKCPKAGTFRKAKHCKTLDKIKQ